MTNLTPTLTFFLKTAKLQAVMARRFDAGLRGLGFSEFLILLHLSQAKDGKIRRIDLADKLGLTASGITRLLAPMEKVGLVKREASKIDARVSTVVLSPGGKRKLLDSIQDAELIAHEAIPAARHRDMKGMTELMTELAGR